MSEPIVSVRSPVNRRFKLSRGRLLALAVAAGLVAFAGVTVWRMRNPDVLPDVGDPFDVAEARRPVVIADQDNAFVAYAEAHKKLSKASRAVDDALWNAVWDDKNPPLRWSSVDAAVRAYQERNRPALEIWRQGSERPDAVYIQPSEITFDTVIGLIPEAAELARLALLEAGRHEEKGAMDEAWAWYRAQLRASRLIGRHCALVQRVFGARILGGASRQIVRWAADGRVDAKLLRQALDDAIAADALTEPLSEAVKIDYLVCIRELEERTSYPMKNLPMPGGRGGLLNSVVTPPAIRLSIVQFRLVAGNDVEKSRRAIRLFFANWLAQVDRAPSQRARIEISRPALIYAADSTVPPAASAVPADVLLQALDHTVLARVLMVGDDIGGQEEAANWPWEGDGPLAREPRRRAVLIVKLAAELYRREHGVFPATVGALVGPYLKVLPEGIGPNAPVPDGID
jgi:hypothetical protein